MATNQNAFNTTDAIYGIVELQYQFWIVINTFSHIFIPINFSIL